jgi:hypothetical protein
MLQIGTSVRHTVACCMKLFGGQNCPPNNCSSMVVLVLVLRGLFGGRILCTK